MLTLVSDLPPAQARRAIAALATSEENQADAQSLADFKSKADEAFKEDMQPLCKGIAAALHAGDLAALRGLRALLPHYLEQMSDAPALADLLALQLGSEIIVGMSGKQGAGSREQGGSAS